VVHRRILTIALLALMLPGLILAQGASLSVCLCGGPFGGGGPLGGIVELVGGGDCCAPAGETSGCCVSDPAPAPCCGGEREQRPREDGPTVGSRPCDGCAALAIDAVDLSFEPHASGESRGGDGPSVEGAAAPPTPRPSARMAPGSISERGPPADRLDRTTPAALRRGDRPMRN